MKLNINKFDIWLYLKTCGEHGLIEAKTGDVDNESSAALIKKFVIQYYSSLSLENSDRHDHYADSDMNPLTVYEPSIRNQLASLMTWFSMHSYFPSWLILMLPSTLNNKWLI